MAEDEPLTVIPNFESESSIVGALSPELPKRVGRYRIERLLGKGGFGLVYLAHDEQLNRPVAVKVPHAGRVVRPEDAEPYLAEARIVARLEHPNIVPVHDVGSTVEHPFFIVSRYVEGTDLATRLKQSKLPWRQAAQLVATVAEALHYAHKQGLVHRDVKPGNILIDPHGNPFLVDFGLALREEDLGKGPQYAGTLPYMSPEQARGEGHRVDGRSDICSLGVVFYEMLAGRQPFRAESQAELLEQVSNHEPRPLRQTDEGIPKELERICFKALSKRASERYMTAKDMADDLRHFLAEQTISQPSGPGAQGSASRSTPVVSQPPSTSIASSQSVAATPLTPTSDQQLIKIVPKGLRSFDVQDADFFLELLPGPRDRDGLPDSIRFWKTRIEEGDAEKTFSVGLICGPSGCGKSSLVKAGLLPRLSDDVLAVFIEATAKDTESRLANGLRKKCPALPGDLGLKETLAALRRGHGIPVGKKVLIVIDQFEQWLHAKKEETNTELVQALRQCDGGRIQCIVMVRDDFWMAVIRFMRELEIRLVEGQNSVAVDLFDTDHARKVLAAFGRAFGKLPQNASETNKEQKEFLKQAVSGLAQEGKVISIRLALFAEMLKGKAWTPASLKAVGGTEGVGVTFLEETFSAATAPPEHRYHQKAARADLKVLLPDSGSDIKGHMRSYAELLEASGYGNRPKDFDDLIHILDNEIRLITPTDPEGKETEGDSVLQTRPGQKYYQLTHDYLVHSIREWLTRKQKETRRGRAELLLADRATVWSARPENRQLPSLLQWFQIKWFTVKANWTAPQTKMMRRAGRLHGTRASIAAVAAVAVLFSAWEINGRFQAASLVEQLGAADIAEVPAIVRKLDGYRRWADRLLREQDAQGAQDSNKKLNLDLALLPVHQGKVAELRDALLRVSPSQFLVVRDALLPDKNTVADPLWDVALDSKRKDQQRFQAACALATYASNDQRWSKINTLVAGRLVTFEASDLVAWREALRPAKAKLIEPLAVIYRDTKQKEQSRTYATETLSDYVTDRPDELFDLLADAELFQFPVLFDKLAMHKEKSVALAHLELAKRPPEKATEDQKEVLARRQANASVALLRLGAPTKVWPLLKASPDPRVRSYIIHWLSPLGGNPEPILQRLDTEPDVTIRRALVLTLGEFTDTQFSPAQRQPLIEKLLMVYENEPDAGLHGAAEWLLRKWGQRNRLEAVVEKLKCDEKQLQAQKSTDKRHWYVNTQKQTFVIIDAGQFLMGSPDSEPSRFPNETTHRCRIGRQFAIATTEVTKEQFGRFQTTRPEIAKVKTGDWIKTDDSPQTSMTWYEAAHYCNWLSEQQGIGRDQWCYEPNKQGKYAAGMKAKEKFWELTGYRLPTEAEWEYACRAGTVTSRYYGLSERLLPQYAWFSTNGRNRAWPVGSLKPNDLGLFDMLGNAFEWCFDGTNNSPEQRDKVFDDIPLTQPVEAGDSRLLRGGTFYSLPELVRSAYRSYVLQPNDRFFSFGFRPARTYP